MSLLIPMDGTGPLRRRIALGLKSAVHSGRLAAGSKAPSSRELARMLGVSRNVVLIAYDELIAEGYFEAREGAGTFVSRAPPNAAVIAKSGFEKPSSNEHEQPRLSKFGARAAELHAHRGYVDEAAALSVDFQYWHVAPDPEAIDDWARLARARLRSPRLEYACPDGALELRRAVAQHIGTSRAIETDADDIIIVSGAQQALDLIARTVIDPGDRVLIEEPHYQGAQQSFAAAGAAIETARVDDFGINVAGIAPQSYKLLFATPSHQFPTGASMPFSRRLEVLNWCHAANAWLIEDDYDSEYQHDGKRIAAIRALDAERVVYVGTFARAFAPGLRLGFVIAPPALRESLLSAKWLADRGSSLFEQLVLADFIDSGSYERHLRRMSRRYGEKRAHLIRALRREFGDDAAITGASAGIHVFLWLNLRTPADAPLVARAARAAGVGVYSGCRYFSAMPPRGGFLLGYATTPLEHIDDGVARFAEIWRRYVSQPEVRDLHSVR